MNKLRGLWRRVVGTVRRRGGDEGIAAELESHLAMHVEENLRRGMTAEEARRQALIALGGVEQVKESYRAQRGVAWIESLTQDVRFASRMLRKNPGFTAIAVVTLALGIGANTAIFTVVYGTLVRALPFPGPNRILQLAETANRQTNDMSVTSLQLNRLRDFGQPFEAMAGFTDIQVNLSAANGAEHVRTMPVSSGYFDVLGVHPAAGRDFTTEEDSGAGERVAILGYGLALRRFGSATSALGQTIYLSGEPYSVVGVMPAHFDTEADDQGLDIGVPFEMWIPLARVAKTVGSGENLSVLARLKKGTTQAELYREMDLVTQDFRKEYPGDVSAPASLVFLSYAKVIGVSAEPYLLVLMGATGFVLLIACANISNLLLARGSGRTREMAVRLAMGASRVRLLRQLLTESTLIALAGSALGLAAAREAMVLLVAMAPAGIPRLGEIRFDGTIFAFALVTALVIGALVGIVPALSAGKTNLNLELREGSSGAGTGWGRARLRQGLVAGEFALSMVLLTGAGLMIATCAKLVSVDPGFDPHHVLTMAFWLGGTSYDTTDKIAMYNNKIETKITALPGVKTVGIVAAGLPLEARNGNYPVRIAGPEEKVMRQSNYHEVSPGYFQAMGMHVLEGRGVLDSDTSDATRVVVVNGTFANRYFPGHDAIGEDVFVTGVPRTVVGVVADVKSSLGEPVDPATFIPAAQATYQISKLFEGWFPRRLVVRTAGDPLAVSAEVGEAVASVDSSVATGAMVSMDEVMAKSMALQNFMMVLLSLFGGLAIVLASVGIYGVISYGVSQRTREIGIRMALGARPGEVLRMILAQALKLVGAGVVFGVVAAAMLTRLLQGLIYGVSVRDPLVFALGIVAMVGVAMAACYVPARRAMRVEPMVALRHE